MKRLVFLTALILACFSLFALQNKEIIYSDAYKPQECIRTGGLEYTLFRNQASLADNFGFSLELPSVSASVYNAAGVLATTTGSNALAGLVSGQSMSENLLDLALTLVEQIQSKTKKNGIVSADLGMGFAVNSFAMGINSQLSVKTFNPSSVLSMSACAEGDVSVSFAYGRSVWNDGVTKVSVGAALRPSYRIYTYLDADEIAKYASDISNINQIFSELKFNEGIGLPVDFSVAFSRLNGKVELVAQAENVLGLYFINEGVVYSQLEKNILPLRSSKVLYTPMKLNLSLVLNPEMRFINPSVALEFMDINGYIKNDIFDDVFMPKNLLMHLNADINLNIIQILDVTAGIHGGYLYGGAGLSIGGNRIEALYNWSEFGDELGESPVDTLTLRVRLGYGL